MKENKNLARINHVNNVRVLDEEGNENNNNEFQDWKQTINEFESARCNMKQMKRLTIEILIQVQSTDFN